MRDGQRNHIRQILGAISDGTLTRSDTVALFILLRDDAPSGSMVRDIGDCIAHPKRDRGYVQISVQKWVLNVTEGLMHGGQIDGTPLFAIDLLIDELVDEIHRTGLTVDLEALHSRARLLAVRIGQVLDGTTVVVQDATCVLQGPLLGFAAGITDDGMPSVAIHLTGATRIFPRTPIAKAMLAPSNLPTPEGYRPRSMQMEDDT